MLSRAESVRETKLWIESEPEEKRVRLDFKEIIKYSDKEARAVDGAAFSLFYS